MKCFIPIDNRFGIQQAKNDSEQSQLPTSVELKESYLCTMSQTDKHSYRFATGLLRFRWFVCTITIIVFF
jgi:hypothetical protein